MDYEDCCSPDDACKVGADAGPRSAYFAYETRSMTVGEKAEESRLATLEEREARRRVSVLQDLYGEAMHALVAAAEASAAARSALDEAISA